VRQHDRPAADRITLRTRSALRSTSRRARSTTLIGLGKGLGKGCTIERLLTRLGGIAIELQGQSPYLAIQRTDLYAQPRHIATGRHFHQVPDRAQIALTRLPASRPVRATTAVMRANSPLWISVSTRGDTLRSTAL
jgi:hypothetical protein